jgi:hypothetical protein
VSDSATGSRPLLGADDPRRALGLALTPQGAPGNHPYCRDVRVPRILSEKWDARCYTPHPFILESQSVVHPASRRHGRHGRLLLGSLGDHRLSSDKQASNRGCILQRRTDHLRRINDAVRHEVFELAGLRVQAERIGIVVLNLADYYRAVFAALIAVCRAAQTLRCLPGLNGESERLILSPLRFRLSSPALRAL